MRLALTQAGFQSNQSFKADENKLVFDKVGDHYFLAQIWTSARDEGLLVPESTQEKGLRASNSGPQGGVETVIVALR